jgi:hypothetical protein
MIAARGHRVLKYELLLRGVDLGKMSPAQVVAVIRSAVRPDRKPYAHETAMRQEREEAVVGERIGRGSLRMPDVRRKPHAPAGCARERWS